MRKLAEWVDADGTRRWITPQGLLLKSTEDNGPLRIDQKDAFELVEQFVDRVDRFYRSVEGVKRIR